MKRKILYSILCGLVLSGCDNYLDITPKGSTLLTSVADYDQWLNDPKLSISVSSPYCNLNFLGDNIDVPSVPVPATQVAYLAYLWQPQFTLAANATPEFWGDHYSNINKFNTVLAGIDEATGSAFQRKSMKAEALLGRAFEYFYLVNEYGTSYDSTTASKDLAVPFVTSNDVSQTVPGRSTVQEIYDHIIKDITDALPDLPNDNSANRFRGSKAAGYSILARTYFYARNYTKARENAELALENGRAVMMNFNTDIPAAVQSSIQVDAIYCRISLTYFPVTLEHMKSFEANDLRVKKLYLNGDGNTYTIRGGTNCVPALVTGSASLQYENNGTSVQEMKLIIAEAAARSNDLTTAQQQMDDVRKARFAPADFVPTTFTDQESALEAVLLERRHELAFNALRWFDMRRLDKENRMGTVNRYDAQGNVIATLPPHSNTYTLQIPSQVLSFNPDMPQNPL